MEMTRETAERTLRVAGGKLPSSTAEAKVVIRAVLNDRYGAPDRWGNFKISPDHRIQIGEKVVREQKKHTADAGGAWFNVDSKSLIEYSLSLVASAAKTLGDDKLFERARTRKKTRAATSDKRARASAAEDKVKNGPGFYVLNEGTEGRTIADHEKPFSGLEEAIAFAHKRFSDFVGMKFTYLLPVRVVYAPTREAAVGYGPLGMGRDPSLHVYWVNGKFRGHSPDPRQATMGFSGGRSHFPSCGRLDEQLTRRRL